MDFDYGQLVTQIISVVGGISGLISLGILLVKYVFEKPKLKTFVEEAYYGQSESNSNLVFFHLSLRFENKGRRNTTVHGGDLNFMFKEKEYSLSLSRVLSEMIVIADDTKRASLELTLNKNLDKIPEGDIKNGILKIVHTHGKETIPIPIIKQGRL